jgi:uncharacterized protein YbcI
MSSAQEPSRPDAASGTQLAALSDAMVKLHKETFGRGPTNARCYLASNSVVCLLFGGLTPAERTLLASAGTRAVEEQRQALHRVMREPARELVEEQLSRRVTAMTMATDPANELETAVFVLDAPSES